MILPLELPAWFLGLLLMKVRSTGLEGEMAWMD